MTWHASDGYLLSISELLAALAGGRLKHRPVALLKRLAKCTVLCLVYFHRRVQIGRNMKHTLCIFTAMGRVLSPNLAVSSLPVFDINIHPTPEGGSDATRQA